MTALTVRGVTKRFGSTEVLRGVDLTVPDRALTAVLGPSGCGKTTMLRIIAGFLDPDGGTVAFGDRVVAGEGRAVPPQKRRVGYVPQEGALFPHLTVAENIGFGLRHSARRQSSRIADLLRLVGLAPSLAARRPDELSGGQQQRVALARALAPNPSVVLLDEPFASLDAGLREATGHQVATALREAEATAILVTHDQSEALSLADQVAVMREGQLVQVATPREVYQSPADAGVAQFVGAAALVEATSGGQPGRVDSPLGMLQLSSPNGHDTARVLVRPEQVRLRPLGQGVPALVADVSYYGHDAAVRLRLDSSPRLTVVARVLGTEVPEVGDHVGVEVVGTVSAVPATPAS
ncbi:MAG TPA: ABC transporter ATP-binding protein [Segeticoccus sp.]|uniref:ABC transporter ATP-binding protein n=1 Tax=Segeticoccus sp. TaxID=2706531 RepID=UPI002D807E74|nr:ABC transporter ATP-binding protein [Segeticoccus sp.]HET8602141.1 ABC transporter ATP-binding protein [Segeticoccus sp.]